MIIIILSICYSISDTSFWVIVPAIGPNRGFWGVNPPNISKADSGVTCPDMIFPPTENHGLFLASLNDCSLAPTPTYLLPLPKVFSVMGRLIIPPPPFKQGVELQGIAVKVPLETGGLRGI